MLILQIGPGVVFFNIKTVFGSGIMISVLTPQEPLVQKLTNIFYVDWWIPSFISRMMIRNSDIQVRLVTMRSGVKSLGQPNNHNKSCAKRRR